MGTGPTKTASSRLSQRELEVARMVAQGLTNRQIASALFISERTVDGPLEHVREKLGVNTRAQVAAWVVRRDAGGIPAVPAATVLRPASRRWVMAHPRAWVATALVLALLAAVAGVLRLTAPSEPIIRTVAGIECAKQSYLGGCFNGDIPQKAINAGLRRPTDVAIDRNGLIYVADFYNHRVRRIDAKGTISTVVGGGTESLKEHVYSSSTALEWASGIALDNQNNLLLLVSMNQDLEVWRVEKDGYMSLVKSLGAPTDAGPYQTVPFGGLAVANDGTLYIADRYGNRVYRLAADGTLASFAGTGEFGFCCDGASAASAQLAWPIGLALDKHGNLYIADSANNRIRMVDRKGTITTVAGSDDLADGDNGPAVSARLSFPFGVAVAPNGSLAIADTGNHRLRRVTAGIIYALAGTGRGGFWGDQRPALQAGLSGPEGIAFDAKGNLFIADTENHRVREIPEP